MAENDVLLSRLEGLELTRLGDDQSAGLLVSSLPLPRGAQTDWSMKGCATSVKPMGQWYDSTGPRRLLLAADSGGEASKNIKLTKGSVKPSTPPPTAEMETFEYAAKEDFEAQIYWERSMLKIQWKGRWVALAMGMRVNGNVHWWEHCNIDIFSKTESCVELEMGGVIPYIVTTREMIERMKSVDMFKKAKSPDEQDTALIHVHNWLNGNIYARLHANGVCEVYVHHVNSMFFDDGGDLENAVPVLGIRVADDEEAFKALCGSWDGSIKELEIGGITFDLSEVSRLAIPEKPGKVEVVDGFLVLQPYLGVELWGGEGAKKRPRDDGYIWKAEEQIIPRGCARTLRFSLSLNSERSPRVARYLAPSWWYGLCEEFQAKSLLPVSNVLSKTTDETRHWIHKYIYQGGFEDGITPTHVEGDTKPNQRVNPAAGEGDAPGTLFLSSYRTTDPLDYVCAMRSSYAFTDIILDHATNRVMCWPFGPDAVALPLQRAQAPFFAWLETGDPYCFNSARAIIDTAYSWHKNSWPRRSTGRDAMCIHSMIMFYRYLGDKHYLELARNMIHDVGVTQWPNGAWGDQGGGAGIHGASAYISKPWMGWLATMGILDYLELFPDDQEAFGIVKKFVDWMMSERGPKYKRDAEIKPENMVANGWTYMHSFKGKELPGVNVPDKPVMTHLFHLEYMARLLPWFSFLTGDESYFDAFMDSYEGVSAPRSGSYWEAVAIFLFLPWLQDRLWDAQLTGEGVTVHPSYFGKRTPKTGVIATPDGPVTLKWTAPNKLDVQADVPLVIVQGESK